MIKIMWKNLCSQKRGSALLVAMLIMGILLAVSLVLSTLILREMYVTRSLIDSGKAFYAAESGIEMSLYGLNNELPGWQPNDNGEYALLGFGEDNEVVAEYTVDNRCNAFPCFSSDFDIDASVAIDNQNGLSDEFAEVFYYELDLNETLTIPLFVSQDGKVMDVEDFTVEFWTPLNVKEHLDVNLATDTLTGWDVLRWKIMGFEERDEGFGPTETISDFTAVSAGTDASEPSWFGTVDCDEAVGDRYVEGIECLPYPEPPVSKLGEVCGPTQAREFYDYVGDDGTRQIVSENIHGCYDIGEFLRQHSLNYLTLTNLVNKSVFKPSLPAAEKEAISKLYVRVEFFGGGEEDGRIYSNETVREFAEIYAHGYSGDSKKSLSAKIRKDSFMPVFNYSLYSTYKGE